MIAVHFVGARPNFPKLSAVYNQLSSIFESQVIVHTGQHYDYSLSESFFRELELPEPQVNFNVGSGREAIQIAKVLDKADTFLAENRYELMFVYGDVYSTLGATIAGVKNQIPVAHVESGLRSFDLTMPEEINRVLVDHASTLRFATTQDDFDNLIREGVDASSIFLVGNTMIDTLSKYKVKYIDESLTNNLNEIEDYVLVTLHRPSNIEDEIRLGEIWRELNLLSEQIKIVFPMHPRTRKQIDRICSVNTKIVTIDPLGYFEFIQLVMGASFVITDSGGIQEESSFLKVPCFTLRENTERPITIRLGTNHLIRVTDISNTHAMPRKEGKDIPFWDGNASQRIAVVVSDFLEGKRL